MTQVLYSYHDNHAILASLFVLLMALLVYDKLIENPLLKGVS